VNKKASRSRQDVRDEIRARLQSVASQAVQAQRLSVDSDNLCDLIDDIDNELQAVIALVNRVRRDGEVT
jgi:hypothetical protein